VTWGMAAELRLERVGEALSCTICLDAFCPEGGRRPVSLPCAHTFCTAVSSSVELRGGVLARAHCVSEATHRGGP
jgi:hypothetical protein